MPLLLGIDNGLTVTKAVLFDETGAQVAVARRRVPQSIPRARHVERDMDGLWTATAEAIREAIRLCGRPAGDIAAVAATAHGDGIYLLDRDRRPLGRAILSLDSRAGGIVDGWTAAMSRPTRSRSPARSPTPPHPRHFSPGSGAMTPTASAASLTLSPARTGCASA
jgi:L-xylulokinase